MNNLAQNTHIDWWLLLSHTTHIHTLTHSHTHTGTHTFLCVPATVTVWTLLCTHVCTQMCMSTRAKTASSKATRLFRMEFQKQHQSTESVDMNVCSAYSSTTMRTCVIPKNACQLWQWHHNAPRCRRHSILGLWVLNTLKSHSPTPALQARCQVICLPQCYKFW